MWAMTRVSCRDEKNGKMMSRELLLLAIFRRVTVKGESITGFYAHQQLQSPTVSVKDTENRPFSSHTMAQSRTVML